MLRHITSLVRNFKQHGAALEPENFQHLHTALTIKELALHIVSSIFRKELDDQFLQK
jgi:hypothetical protein